MDEFNKQQIDLNEIENVIQLFEKLGYKREVKSVEKLVKLAKDCPDKDLLACAQEMYEWFSEADKRGRFIKSYHLTFRNWVKKDYAPKRKKSSSGNFFEREDIV